MNEYLYEINDEPVLEQEVQQYINARNKIKRRRTELSDTTDFCYDTLLEERV